MNWQLDTTTLLGMKDWLEVHRERMAEAAEYEACARLRDAMAEIERLWVASSLKDMQEAEGSGT